MDFLRLLSDEELKSVIGIIHPSEHYYAKQQADRALEEVKAITFFFFFNFLNDGIIYDTPLIWVVS